MTSIVEMRNKYGSRMNELRLTLRTFDEQSEEIRVRRAAIEDEMKEIRSLIQTLNTAESLNDKIEAR